MPLYGGISAIIFFAAMGLPGLCGFIGEVMVVLSAWKFAPNGQQWVGITFSVLAAVTVVLTAAYILWTIQRVFMGTNPVYKNYKDMTPSASAASFRIPLSPQSQQARPRPRLRALTSSTRHKPWSSRERTHRSTRR
jgi:NADH:ubiquinone oxidoreductase subunit 4 (subunit M)